MIEPLESASPPLVPLANKVNECVAILRKFLEMEVTPSGAGSLVVGEKNVKLDITGGAGVGGSIDAWVNINGQLVYGKLAFKEQAEEE